MAGPRLGILRLGDRAAKKGIMLCISMARGTSLGGYEQIAGLAEAARHEFIRLAWEDLPGSKPAEATAALVSAGRFAGLILARCAGRDGRPRAVAEDEGAWKERLIAFRRVEPDPKMGSFVLLCASRPEGGPPATSPGRRREDAALPRRPDRLKKHLELQAEAEPRRRVPELAVRPAPGPGGGQVDRSVLDEGKAEIAEGVPRGVVEIE